QKPHGVDSQEPQDGRTTSSIRVLAGGSQSGREDDTPQKSLAAQPCREQPGNDPEPRWFAHCFPQTAAATFARPIPCVREPSKPCTESDRAVSPASYRLRISSRFYSPFGSCSAAVVRGS